jgi:anti-anti-sigma factor
MASARNPSEKAPASRALLAGRTGFVALRGALRGAEALAEVCRSATRSHRAVVLDLRDVPFADSDGIRALLQLQAELSERQIRLAVVVPTGSVVRRALSLLGFDRVLDLHETARGAFRAAPRRAVA